MVGRLARINKQQADIREAKEEMRNRTGQEYFFGYHSVQKGERGVYKTDDPTIEELYRTKVYIDSEIHRCEKRMERYIPRPTNVHVKFESDSGESEELFDFDRNERMRREFGEYIEQLISKRSEVVRRMDEMRGTKSIR